MSWMSALWRSTIGKKAVMAVTGIIMIAWLVLHALGNLLAFRGSEAINAYSAFLKSTGELLWLARGILLVSVLLHIIAAVQLTATDLQARPAGYARRDPQVSTIAVRTIRWGGVALLLFVVLHLLHLTFGTIHPAFDHKDVYGNVIAAFQIWWVSLLYLAAMVALGLHLYHGGWSSLRTLGVIRPSDDPLKRRIAAALAIGLYTAFSVLPLAVLLRIIH
jgi:succinate dehydrogenase / fumarate reductase, cytochrome b subunit